VAGCEKRFTFDLDHLAVRIKGQIDRLDQDGDKLNVVDYKTGKSREEAKKNLQMALYSEALRRDAVDDLSGEPGETVLHYLRYPEEPLSSHTFSSEELETYLEKISDVVGGIRKQQFEPNPNAYGVCKWCDFKEFLCPSWEEED
jgi:RecB family exonuclease